MPDVQFGVVVNWTVTEPPSPASWPPGIRMKPSVTVSEYAVPPALTVAVTPDGLLKHVGTATSVYLRSLPFGSTFDSVTRTRTVAGWLFCRTGFEIGFPDPSTKVIVAEGSVVFPISTGGLSFCSPAVPAVFVNVCISHSASLPF